MVFKWKHSFAIGASNVTKTFSTECGPNFCPASVEAAVNLTTSTAAEPIPDSTIYTLMGTYTVCGILAIVVIFFFLDQIQTTGSENRSTDCCSALVATFALMKDTKMLLLIPITAYVGMAQSFVFADFTKVKFYFYLRIALFNLAREMFVRMLAAYCNQNDSYEIIFSYGKPTSS